VMEVFHFKRFGSTKAKAQGRVFFLTRIRSEWLHR
jgi:hypothetical protein